MSIIDLIQKAECTTQLRSRNKEECLQELAELVSRNLESISPERILRALKEREEMGSTGFEHGIAIPHAKIEGLKGFSLAMARAPRGVKFESHDGKKSSLFFVIIGPAEASSEHLKILAQISRVTRHENVRTALMNTNNPIDFKELFVRYADPDIATKKEDKGKNKLLIVILTESRFFDEVMQLYTERGIRGAAVMDSTGISQQLMNIPLFSSFLDFLGEHSDTSKTIITVIPEKEIAALTSGIEELTGNLDNHTGAMIMAVDLFYFKGSLES
ncbi:PTS sugar transporter subunit IIA [bacterium]|nr:PTS sugar transporter subunit IIA [bacterium]